MGSDALLFFLFALVYFVTSVFSAHRYAILLRDPSCWRQTRLFYLLLLIQTCLRAISFTVAMFSLPSSDFSLEYLMLNVPDSLFVSAYLILLWMLITSYRLAHVPSARSIVKGVDVQRMRLTAKVILSASLIWLGIESLSYCLILINVWTTEGKDLEMETIDLVLPLLMLLIGCYLQYRYSGVLYKSLSLQSLLKSLNRVTLIWSICRLIRGIAGLFAQFEMRMNVVRGLVDYSDPKHFFASVLFTAVLLLSEVFCFFLVLDFGFVDKFRFTVEVQALIRSVAGGEDSGESSLLRSGEIEVLGEVAGRRHSLGRVFKAKVGGQEVACRQITFPRMNTYVFEEFQDELEAIKRCNFRHALPVLAGRFEPLSVRILTPFVSAGSLYSLLHERQEALPYPEKLSIMLQTAAGLQELHAHSKPHGHLSSHNILLAPSGVQISDFGLQKLKKFAGVVIGYSNKSAWSSPEQLAARCKTADKVKESDDVYSFGLLLWEVLTEKEPFAGVSVEKVREMVGEGLRPEIPAGVEEELGRMMRLCWNCDPQNRPSIGAIYTALSELSARSP